MKQVIIIRHDGSTITLSSMQFFNEGGPTRFIRSGTVDGLPAFRLQTHSQRPKLKVVR